MLETAVRMEPEIARKHYLDYRSLQEKQRSKEDEQIQRSYLELSRGRAIIDAQSAVEVAGLGADGCPKLAFSRADQAFVNLFVNSDELVFSACDRRWDTRRHRKTSLTLVWPERGGLDWGAKRAAVPSIPPAHRPSSSLERYWIMWEVPEGGWDEVPSDPALLRRLNHTTFSVLAVWDLTEVERMVLRGREDS